MANEFRLAARRLMKDRWTAVTAVLTVALGAGLTLAVFAAGFGLLLRPLPYDPASRLSLVSVRSPESQIDEWRGRLSMFERLTAYASEGLVISGGGDTRLVRGAYVDEAFFEILHARPIVFDRSPDARRFRLAGWLRSNVSTPAAAAEVERIQRELRRDSAPAGSERHVESAHVAMTRDVRSTVLVCGAAAGLLWIVTCANLASILVGRTIRRRRELAVCYALGAGRWRRAVSVLSEAALITLDSCCALSSMASARTTRRRWRPLRCS
jgi:hypothetical protein